MPESAEEKVKECLDLRSCSFPAWYRLFSKVTFESISIPIPTNVLSYLLHYPFVLPKECSKEKFQEFCDDLNSAVADDDDDDDEPEPATQPEFGEFSKEIERAIEQLGGMAFMKTNWCSPKDASWITAGQTQCTRDITDVYQLLKASKFARDDCLTYELPVFNLNLDGSTPAEMLIPKPNAAESTDEINKPTNIHLIFRKWYDIHPGTEYRCFVKNRNLIGITPRDWPEYHGHMATERVDIVKDIVSFYKEHILPKYLRNDYIFDVIRASKDHVTLVDFSPLNEKYCQDTFAFSWEELTRVPLIIPDEEQNDPEFRYLDSSCGILPNKRNAYGIPLEISEFYQSGIPETQTPGASGTIPTTLNDTINDLRSFIAMQRNGASLDTSDDSSDESAELDGEDGDF